MSDHTPTPWYYGIAYCPDRGPQPYEYVAPGYYDNVGLIGADGNTAVGCDEYNVFNSPADAAFIVRAVNAHEEIVGELENLLGIVKAYAPNHDRSIDRARKAIAKAKGE